MGTYCALVEVDDAEAQNVQEFVSLWGRIREDISTFEAELKETYAILGEHDFLVLFEAVDQQEALRIAIAIERYGLDTQTMEIFPIDEFGGLVDDA